MTSKLFRISQTSPRELGVLVEGFKLKFHEAGLAYDAVNYYDGGDSLANYLAARDAYVAVIGAYRHACKTYNTATEEAERKS